MPFQNIGYSDPGSMARMGSRLNMGGLLGTPAPGAPIAMPFHPPPGGQLDMGGLLGAGPRPMPPGPMPAPSWNGGMPGGEGPRPVSDPGWALRYRWATQEAFPLAFIPPCRLGGL